MFKAIKIHPLLAMSDRNRSFGAALGVVVALIALAAIAATFAP
jgi:hypothetical protein